MRLKKPSSPSGSISLVPMIDVLMIMLVFFMVTSTYLNLRMIPMAASASPNDADFTSEETDAGPPSAAAKVLLRLDPDGRILLRGKPETHASLSRLLTDKLAGDASLSVILLPSGRANTQDLVSLLDTATSAGVRQVRIVRLGEQP